MQPRVLVLLAIAIAIALALAGCATPERKPAPTPPPLTEATPVQLTVQAGMNETWNAVGQLLVDMPDVTWEGRSQMMGLNAVRYRGESLLVLTRAVPASATIRTLTTEVTVATQSGKRLNSVAAADLMLRLARALPAEIERVKAGLEEEAAGKR